MKGGCMPVSIPTSARSIEHLKKRAKALLRAARGGDHDARHFVHRYCPGADGTDVRLSDVQHAIARHLGLESWPKLIEQLSPRKSDRQRSVSAELGAPRGQRYATWRDELEAICTYGLKTHLGRVTAKALRRLTAEINWAESKGFCEHFVVMGRAMEKLRAAGLLTGTARGSDASSLMLYALGATKVNPLSYGLQFERLLTPATEGVELHLDASPGAFDALHGILERGFPSERIVTARAAFYEGSATIVPAVEILPKDGRAEHTGRSRQQHAHGLGSPGALSFFVTELPVLALMQRLLGKKRTCEGNPFAHIPPNDPSVFAFLSSPRASKLIAANGTALDYPLIEPRIATVVKPATLQELADCIALTPDTVDSYVRRDSDALSGWPELRGIVAPTRGMLLYQEQVMEIATRVGGLRRHAKRRFLKSFKKPFQHNLRERERFVARATQRYPESRVNDLIRELEHSRLWWFNKGHAVAYALLVYYAAYFMVHATGRAALVNGSQASMQP